MASVALSQPAKMAIVESEVLGLMCGSCVGMVDRAARNVDWPSVLDARVNLPMKLARVDFVGPTPPATPDQAVAAFEGVHRGCRFRCCCEGGTFEQARCTVDGFG